MSFKVQNKSMDLINTKAMLFSNSLFCMKKKEAQKVLVRISGHLFEIAHYAVGLGVQRTLSEDKEDEVLHWSR